MDKSGAGAGFLRELRFPLPIYIPSALHNHLHYHPRRAQSARWGRRANRLTNQKKKKKRKAVEGMSLTHIRQVIGSNFGGAPDTVTIFSVVFLSLPRKYRDITLIQP
jgi:hypothetical protein